MSLTEEIDKSRQTIKTDGYAMSIGEIASLYKTDEIALHPEFQRYFRWSLYQKTRLIESLLLGIPIPSIFVAQRHDGVWDVIDGLQRLSTILEFMGELKDESGNLLPALVLQGTKSLPSLQGKRWQSQHDEDANALTPQEQLIIKRAKIGVSILLRESDAQGQFDLFDRLNTGGSILSAQELRNSILASINPDFLQWLGSLRDTPSFQQCLTISDRQRLEQYDMELVVRFLTLRTATDEKMASMRDLGTFLTDEVVGYAKDGDYPREVEQEAFIRTFMHLEEALGSDSFRRYDATKGRFLGAFSVTAYEFLSLGLGFHFERIGDTITLERSAQTAKSLWSNQELQAKVGSGVTATSRIPISVQAGREAFGE